jgi:hypothetical protein
MSELPSEYYIDKWARYIKIRDNFICQMCEEKGDSRRLLHSHHIERQADKPELAVDLDNGVCLCEKCHLAIVHSTHKNHKKFRVIFKRWVRRKANMEFQEKYQNRLHKG